MAQLLVDSGHLVHIIEWDRTGKKPKEEMRNGIAFKRVSMKTRYGLDVFCLMPVWFCFAFVKLVVEKYDMVQPQNLDSLIPAFISKKVGGVKSIIYDLADFYRDAYLFNVPILRGLAALSEKLLIRKSEAVILTSERQILEVEAKNLPRKHVFFYNSPVEFQCKNLHYRNEETGIDSPLFVLYAGVFGFGRVRLLMNMVKAIRGLPVRFYIAGYGEYENSLQQLSKVNSQVVFLGRLDSEEILEFTQKADLVVLPYDPKFLVNRVGLPNKLFEAMSCGSVVLAPRGTYMGEIVENENVGIVVDYDDITNLRLKIWEVVLDRGGLKLYADKAKKLYLEKFEPRKMIEQYLKLVKQVITG